MKFDQPPDDVEWNEWGPPVRVEIEHAPVMLFARAVKDDGPVYASERAPRGRLRPGSGAAHLHVRDVERGRVPRHPARGRHGLDVRELRRRRGERSRATACSCTANSTSRITGR